MDRPVKNSRLFRAAPLALLMLLCACERAPAVAVSTKDDRSLPPAIIPGVEDADPAARPSYEVGIATAAADRNNAKEKCAAMPDVERVTCEAAADAAFLTAEADLDDLRGNQQ